MPRAPSWSWSAPCDPPSQRGHPPGSKLSKDTLIKEVYAQRQLLPPHLIERRLRFPATLEALQRFAPSPIPALHLIQHVLMLAGMHLLQHRRTFQSAYPSMVGPAHHGIKLPSLHVSLFGEGVKACERVRIFLSVPQWRSCPEEMLSHARALLSATAWKCIKTGKMKMWHFSGTKFAAGLAEETCNPLPLHEIQRKRTRRQNFSLDAKKKITHFQTA